MYIYFVHCDFCSFVLNTVIEYPHDGRLIQLTFQPSEDDYELLCATISEDRKFKIWNVYDSSDIYRKWESVKIICSYVTY